MGIKGKGGWDDMDEETDEEEDADDDVETAIGKVSSFKSTGGDSDNFASDNEANIISRIIFC